MTLLPSLVTWSEQVFILTAAAALAAVTLTHPRARLRMWQGLLALLLLLPMIEPWKTPPEQVESVTVEMGAMTIVQTAAVPRWHWRAEDWLWVLAIGAALQILWIGAGFLRLRQYRRQARTLTAPIPFSSRSVRWYSSDSVPGPVTYGWRRPVILLPTRVLELPADLREAIECHELIHVRRADWLFVLAEALVRGVLWFHPAIWFVLNRIQLSREQVVDQEAVGVLRNRESYLDALVAVAGHKLYPDLAPAPLFLRKRHLAARVKAVMKEVNMSRPRIAAGVTAVCSALSIAVCAAIWMFPFVGEAQTSPDSPGVTVDAGGTLMHRAPVRVPLGVTVAGTVTLQATLDAKGEVSDARVLSGPDELRKEALSSVLQWHYQPGPTQAQISIQFAGGVQGAPVAVAGGRGALTVVAPTGVAGARGPAFATKQASSAEITGTVKSIQFIGVSPEAERELRQQLQIHEGDVLSQADLLVRGGAVRNFDNHLVFTHSITGTDGNREFNVRVVVAPGAAVVPPPPPAGAQASAGGPLKVGAAVQSAKLISHPTPVYPPVAKSARVQGTVVLQATIGTDGTVQNLVVLSADSPLLVPSAIEAVKQWVYQPTLLNGNPVQVVTEITVNFTLQDSNGTAAAPAAQTAPLAPGVYRAGSGVSNPVPTYRPEPKYSEEARKAKWQGAVLLSLVVDATGTPTSIKIVRPLGLGLDEKAIEAVQQWQFKPGMKDGAPVPVQAQIEVTFRLLDDPPAAN